MSSEEGRCELNVESLREEVEAFVKEYVDEGMLPFGSVAVFSKKQRKEVLSFMYGRSVIEKAGDGDGRGDVEIKEDTICRIYSMTKPVVAVAIMILYERRKLNLTDPLHKYLPCFSNMQVAVEGKYPDTLQTRRAKTDITIQHLLTHTSGFTYWFLEDPHCVHEQYRADGVAFSPIYPGQLDGMSLQDVCERLAKCPLAFEPGTKWQYSNSFDVLGRVIELISGQSLDEFLKENIFDPLEMKDTGFYVPEEKKDRFSQCFVVQRDEGDELLTEGFVKKGFTRLDNDAEFLSQPRLCAGGGGLVSTIGDYMNFCHMLLHGGTFLPVNNNSSDNDHDNDNGRDGCKEDEQDEQRKKPTQKKIVRILGRKTVELMMGNHLKGDMADYGKASFLNLNWKGVGFGLGGSVVLSPFQLGALSSEGEYAWGGMSSVFFWIDPREGVACVFMTQLVPSSALPLRQQLRVIVNKNIV
eukprot:m.22953 g.22953  ORF g.22953 m.22953 type:complete len:468 (-) comp5500_c0_seq1:325-1728(-)